MKIKLLLILVFTVSISCKTYKLPDAKLKPEIVCGYEDCKPGNLGVVFQFYEKPFSLEVDNNKSMKNIAASVIGHTFPEKKSDGTPNLSGDRALTCSFATSNPFSDGDVVNLVNPTGRKFDYLRTEKLQLDIDATVQGNMEQIKKLNPENEKLPEVEAKLRAAYNKINNKELSIQGRYSEWGLGKEAIERLIKNDGFKECKRFLTEKNYRIITAIGMVYFDITFDQTNLDKFSTDLESEISRLGIKGNVAVNFKREVNQTLNAVTKGGYQIVVWRHANSNDLLLLQ